ncbi:hypothetical protein HDIA_3476 [Hartmannibacter diazotrophicus]|uniref:Uncharacterized protein n=1 Tax=Hartmannibacter diazotrophicus TaxID=1482074 RepID=A0A2C9D9P9_9HYPH|nr:hypothetical protein HDIA_3476 [Hartmannibacter diazotrophicus]
MRHDRDSSRLKTLIPCAVRSRTSSSGATRCLRTETGALAFRRPTGGVHRAPGPYLGGGGGAGSGCAVLNLIGISATPGLSRFLIRAAGPSFTVSR